MTPPLPDPLAQLDEPALRHWLSDGILRMCGLRPGIEQAFAPVANRIGHARDRAWVDELATLVLVDHNTDSPFRARFENALNGTLAQLSQTLDDEHWLPAQHAIDLMRQIGADRRLPGLQPLAERLLDPPPGLGQLERRKLVASALLALTEARSVERKPALRWAVELARLSISLRGALTEAQLDALRRRLQRLDITRAELAALGLAKDELKLNTEQQIRAALRVGITA